MPETDSLAAPGDNQRRQDRCDQIGVAALVLFAVGAFQATGLGNATLALLLATFAVHMRYHGRVLLRDPITRLGLFFLAYHFIRAAIEYTQLPPESAPDYDRLQDIYQESVVGWTLLWGFLVSGWFLARRGGERLPLALLGLAAVSLLVESAAEFDWSRYQEVFISGAQRSGFGSTGNGIGLLSAIALFGTLQLALPAAVRGLHGTTATWALRLAVALAAPLFLIILLASHSRMAWLALIFVGCTLFAWHRLRVYRQSGRSARRIAVESVGALVLLAAALLAASQINQVRTRLEYTIQGESGVVSAVLAGRWDEVPLTSAGYRVYMYRQGLERFARRPLFGWGPGTSIPASFAVEDGYPFLADRSDLHNGFLIVLVRFGLVGAVPFLLAGGILAWRVARTATSLDPGRRRLAMFCLGAMGITTLVSIMNFRWIHVDFAFTWVLIGGIAFAVSTPLAPRSPGTPSTR